MHYFYSVYPNLLPQRKSDQYQEIFGHLVWHSISNSQRQIFQFLMEKLAIPNYLWSSMNKPTCALFIGTSFSTYSQICRQVRVIYDTKTSVIFCLGASVTSHGHNPLCMPDSDRKFGPAGTRPPLGTILYSTGQPKNS